MIDWEAQWALFAPDYRDGLAHIELPSYGTLRLAPGPGFGDFSHPTTRLTLSLLQIYLSKEVPVVDIGCGSGILSVAALLMGASRIIGIDIDPQALEHTRYNLKLNHFLKKATLAAHPPKLPPSLILMNMIFSEQQTAWKAQKQYLPTFTYMISSGILKTQRDSYLEWTQQQGWDFVEEKEEGEWMAFVFRHTC